jgi:hypothetical protein
MHACRSGWVVQSSFKVIHTYLFDIYYIVTNCRDIVSVAEQLFYHPSHVQCSHADTILSLSWAPSSRCGSKRDNKPVDSERNKQPSSNSTKPRLHPHIRDKSLITCAEPKYGCDATASDTTPWPKVTHCMPLINRTCDESSTKLYTAAQVDLMG